MKNKYLKELTDLLDLYEFDSNEKKEIVEDYSNMFDDALLNGMSNDEVITYLGDPKLNIVELTEGIKKINKAKGKEKIISISPFIATIIFFILGFGFDLWHPGWLIFFIIPISAIVVEMGSNKDSHILTALSPFIASLIFLFLGFKYDLWHPGWLIFIIIPVIAILTERKKMKLFEVLVSLSPFTALVIFFYLGSNGYWHPGWLVFIIIPITGILNEKSIIKIIIGETLLIGGGLVYLYIGNLTDQWELALLSFIPIVAYGIMNGNIEVGPNFDNRRMWIVSVLSLITFLLIGFTVGYWEYIWMIFLMIPLYSIYYYAPKETQLVSMTPFIAFVIFFLFGMIGGYWEFSWMAFLLIPVVAIIKES